MTLGVPLFGVLCQRGRESRDLISFELCIALLICFELGLLCLLSCVRHDLPYVSLDLFPSYAVSHMPRIVIYLYLFVLILFSVQIRYCHQSTKKGEIVGA